MASFSFDKQTKIITADDSFTIQELYDACRDFEDNLHTGGNAEGMDIAKITDAGGKDILDLAQGITTGITMTLLDGWRVGFGDQPGPTWVERTIDGGNLVGEGGAQPTVATNYVNILQLGAVATTIVQTASSTKDLRNLQALILTRRLLT